MGIGWTLSVLLLMTHPLEEPITVRTVIPITDIGLTEDNFYESPIDGKVVDIYQYEGTWTCIIEDDKYEIVFPGLSKVLKKKGEKIIIGESIGKDDLIKEYTKCILIEYREAKLFPQLRNNKLLLECTQGTPIFIPCAGIAQVVDFDYGGKGNYVMITNNELGISLEYWHLQASKIRRSQEINVNEVIGYTGNTGLSLFPRYLLNINDVSNFNEYKGIYIKVK